MRRRITLYIGEQRADLNDDGLVLMNYAVQDLTNPAVLKNSYSHDVELPRTPANEQIFGSSYRVDRRAGIGGTGAAFNASRKTSFTIYTESGTVLAAGYCKLTSVSRDAFHVSLFGGFGELMYSLAYDADSNRRSLASLDYLGGGESELDFTITKETVDAAWQMLIFGYILIPSTDHATYSNLKKNGSVSSSSNVNRYVDTYSVKGGKKYVVSCQQTSTTGACAAVAYDENGTVLQIWFDGGTMLSIVDQEITMPSGAVTLKLQGLTGTQDAVVKYVDPRWNVINFAPCYNGIPTDFQPGKAIASATGLGITVPQNVDGVDYDANGGYTLLNLPQDADEWDAKDLRSYLQRPVLSVRKLLAAIAKPENNGGWTIDMSDIASVKQLDAWLTRPLLPSLGTFKQIAGSATITPALSPITTGTNLGGYTVNLGGAPAGTQVTAKMRVRLVYQVPSAASDGIATLETSSLYGRQVLIIQAIGYASDNTKVAASASYVLDEESYHSAASDVAAQCGYTPDALNQDYVGVDEITYGRVGSTSFYERFQPLELSITGPDIASVEIIVKAYTVYHGHGYGGTDPYTDLYTFGSSYTPTGASFTNEDAEVTITTADGVRSGAAITKQMLLSTDGTPADYLLALCKTCGLYILADTHTKTAQILRRSSFFIQETIDASDRIDTRSVEVVPLAFDAKWYDFKHESVGGRFEKEYKDTEGVDYGIQRVDTNYDFDADTKDVLKGSVLKSCAAVSDSGLGWYVLTGTLGFLPSPLANSGGTFTLWAADGTDLEQTFPSAVIASTPQNSLFPGYDKTSRAEFRDKDNKGVDGADVLLFYDTYDQLDSVFLSDDLPAMTVLAGRPCWLFETAAGHTDVPRFTRYDSINLLALDWGVPRQMDIPGFNYLGLATLYNYFWKTYISDRLDVNNKVIRCKMRLDGLQVGPELLRRFYWWRGSLWAVSSIKNYSLTTFDPADVELVQVRDTSNYI